MKTHHSIFGTAALTAASVLRVVMQIVAFPIIGHILGPQSYGQIALVSPFVFLAMIIAESGLGACIIRSAALSTALEGSVFTFTFGLSALVVILFALLAYPLGYLLAEPAFPPLLIGMSSILLLAAVNVVPAARLLRAQRYDWVACSDVASFIGGIAGLLGGVYFGWGAWSLVAQQIMLWLGKVIVVMIGAHYVPRFEFHWSLVRENLHFGLHLTGATLLSFAARNIDNILIGALMGSTTLGFYALAFQIVCLPQMIFSGPAYSILLSGTSATLRSGQSPAPQILKTLRWLLLVSAPMMVGLAVTAESSVALILGSQWQSAAYLIMLLAPYGIARIIAEAMGAVLIGSGHTDKLFRLNLITATLTIAAIIVGAQISSHAVAIGVSVTSLIGLNLLLLTIARTCDCSLVKLYGTMAGVTGAALLMGGALIALQSALPPAWPDAWRLGLGILAGIVTYSILLVLLMPKSLRTDIAEIRQVLATSNKS